MTDTPDSGASRATHEEIMKETFLPKYQKKRKKAKTESPVNSTGKTTTKGGLK